MIHHSVSRSIARTANTLWMIIRAARSQCPDQILSFFMKLTVSRLLREGSTNEVKIGAILREDDASIIFEHISAIISVM
jgi:hypothetical protein